MAFNSKKANPNSDKNNNQNQVQKKFKNILKLTCYDSALQLGSATDQYGGYSLNLKVAERLKNATETHVYDYDNNTFIYISPKKAQEILNIVKMMRLPGPVWDHISTDLGIWSVEFTQGSEHDPAVEGLVIDFVNTDTEETFTFLAEETKLKGWKHGEDKETEIVNNPTLDLFEKWLEENTKQCVLPHDGFMVSNDNRTSAVGNGGSKFRKGPSNTARRQNNNGGNDYQPNDEEVGDTTSPF